MTDSAFTTEQREGILAYADEHGDRAASLLFGVPEATLRSWRHRAERKVTDHRAGVADAAGDREAAGEGLVETQVPTDDWNADLGCERKVPAKARVIEQFQIGNQYVSRGELRELQASGTADLAIGDLILLGGEQYASFGDANWCVAGREEGALLVRPAKVRRDEKLSDDRSRIVAKGPEDKPRFYRSPEQRQADWDTQPDPIIEYHKRQLAIRGQ